jgi:hypothetical protein
MLNRLVIDQPVALPELASRLHLLAARYPRTLLEAELLASFCPLILESSGRARLSA